MVVSVVTSSYAYNSYKPHMWEKNRSQEKKQGKRRSPSILMKWGKEEEDDCGSGREEIERMQK